MDELSLLRLYDGADESEAAARVRARLRAHIATAERRRTRRRFVLSLALAGSAALALALAAFGYQAFFGKPTPSLRLSITSLNKRYRPLDRRAPLLVGKTEGLLQARSHAGPIDLWKVPLRDGGSCTFVQADAPRARWTPVKGPCWTPYTEQPPLLWDVVHALVGDMKVRVVEGHLGDGITAVELRATNGISQRLLLADGYFLAPLGANLGTSPKLVAFKGDDVVSEVTLPLVADRVTFGGGPAFQAGLTHSSDVLETAAPSGAAVFLAVLRDGNCGVVFALEGSPFDRLCPPTERLSYVSGIWDTVGGLVAAHAGGDASVVELSYANGTSLVASLRNGWALLAFPPGSEPLITSRRADGSAIETSRIHLPLDVIYSNVAEQACGQACNQVDVDRVSAFLGLDEPDYRPRRLRPLSSGGKRR